MNAKSKTSYEDLFTYKKCSVFPPEAQRAIKELGASVDDGSADEAKISKFRNALSKMPASAVSRGTDEIRNIAGIYERYLSQNEIAGRTHKLLRLFKQSPTAEAQFQSYPNLGWLMIFHGNGYLREAALERLATPPCSVFEFTAIVYRLNDWVANVQDAANAYATTQFPKTDPKIISESAFFLLIRAPKFSRWSDAARHTLERAIDRADVSSALYEAMRDARTGPVGQVLKQRLRRSGFDDYLVPLAQDAYLPSLRAVAYESLLNGRAAWLAGYDRQWVNKPLGVYRRVATFETRPIAIDTDFDALLGNAASDTSPQVRKIAADALIARREKATATMDEIAEMLASDRSSSVRSRVDFYRRTRTRA